MPEPEQGIEPGDDAMRLNDRRARTRAGAALGQLSHPDLARRHQRTSLLALCAGIAAAWWWSSAWGTWPRWSNLRSNTAWCRRS